MQNGVLGPLFLLADSSSVCTDPELDAAHRAKKARLGAIPMSQSKGKSKAAPKEDDQAENSGVKVGALSKLLEMPHDIIHEVIV